MVGLGKAAQLNEQAVICQIRCKLPEYLSRFLGAQYSGLYEFKDAVLRTLLNSSVELWKEF